MSETTLRAGIPVLPVGDMAAATAFYRDRLGFKIGYADESYGMLKRDAVEIHLWAATDETWRNRPGHPVESGAESFLAGTASTRIHADGIESLYQELSAAEVIHPNGALSDTPFGTREFTALDLDGNALAFFQDVQ
jgi:catechol 2,3-dioxygenase-like lactoylglutathione lyase family enzyme